MPAFVEVGQFVTDLQFDITAPYSGCRLCGVVYQSPVDRALALIISRGLTPSNGLIVAANDRRERWRELHTRRYHTSDEVERFKQTNLTFTPEAANRLAPLGIIPIDYSDVTNDEVLDALYEAPRVPAYDAEGGT